MDYDVIIAGAGPAGLTAGIYASRGGLKALVIEKLFVGGQMAISHVVDNYPGFENEITGAELAHGMKLQAQNLGVEIITEEIKSFGLTGDEKTVKTSGHEYKAPAVILAMGAKPKHLDIKGEDEKIGAGVSYCATCDGAFFRGRDVAVIGGGNTAVEDSLYLAKFCDHVTIVHRRDSLRALKSMVNAAKKLPNVEFKLGYTPECINGDVVVESLTLKDVNTQKTEELKVAGIFIAVGQEPETEMIKGQVELDSRGFIVAGEDCKTNLQGVYCAGDIRTKELRQIVTAAADGAIAANGVIGLTQAY